MRLREITARRLRNERLTGETHATPEAAVQSLVAVQSQDFTGAKWAVGQRVQNACDADVEAAFARGAILRTHVLRPTWHFVAPADIRWLLALTAPRVHAALAYQAKLRELDARTLRRAGEVVAKALVGTMLTREELGAALAKARIDVSGDRLGHVLMHAELEALICSGAPQGKKQTYALLDERAPASECLHYTREEALATLARRYFASHGPATAADFAWWSGLTLTDAKRGMQGAALVEDRVGDGPIWCAQEEAARARASFHLLSNYDEYVVAYRDRAAFVDPAHAFPREMMLANHLVIRDGQVIGAWTRAFTRDGVEVEARVFAPLDASGVRALDKAVAAFGRFYAKEARLTVVVEKRGMQERGRKKGEPRKAP